MGQSSSSSNPPRRRNDQYYTQNQPPPPRPPPPQFPSSSYAPPQQPYYPSSYYQPCTSNPPRYYNPNPYYAPHQYNWAPMPPVPAIMPPPATPPPFVEHQSTKTVKNDVNLHKHTIQMVPDEQDPDKHLVSFVFDASVDGSITIYYFAKEGPNFTFLPLYPETHTPITTQFKKGPAQKFTQPNKSGIDLNFFSHEELSIPSNDGTFPLVIYADATPQNSNSNIHAQITLAVIERNNEGFKVKVVKQILLIEGERYELQEIFGLVNEEEKKEVNNIDNIDDDNNDDDSGKECVICLSEPRDTAVLPCRHMCLCSECAKALRLQSNKCPICRQPIEQLIEIKINNNAEK